MPEEQAVAAGVPVIGTALDTGASRVQRWGFEYSIPRGGCDSEAWRAVRLMLWWTVTAEGVVLEVTLSMSVA